MKVIIADYGMGNLQSIRNMIRKAGAEAEISSEPDIISCSEHLILPGVGSFDNGITALKRTGIGEAVLNVANRGRKILGICLGMQILFERSEEGTLPGLGLIPGKVVRFSNLSGIKVPHMGWNSVKATKNSWLFCDTEVENLPRFYFVHSYYVVCDDRNDIAGITNYDLNFTSAVCRNNIGGVQFHPEKSHRYGLELFNRLVMC